MFTASKKFLFGDSDKLEFKRSSTNGIARLWTQKAIPKTDHRYWSEYLRVFDSTADVFSLLGVADIRRALVAAPENVCTLVEVLVLHLESLRDDPLLSPFPKKNADGTRTASAITSQITSGFKLGSMLGSSKSAADQEPPRDRVKELLNCCRILTRLLPVIMEGDHDAECTIEADGGLNPNVSLHSDELEHKLLWGRAPLEGARPVGSKLAGQTDPLSREEGQFEIGEVDEIDEDVPDEKRANASDPLGANKGGEASAQKLEEEEEEENLPPSLGERLIEVVMDFLFYSGITIPWTEELLLRTESEASDLPRVNFVIWISGIGSSVDLRGTETVHEAHRIIVLRLLLVLMSKSVYVPAHLHSKTHNPALHYICSVLDRTVVLPLLCSLLNTVSKSATTEGWMGGLMPNAMKPGNMKDRITSVGSSKEHEGSDVLAGLCLQIANVLLNHETIPLGAEATPSDEAGYSPKRPRPSLPALSSHASSDLPTVSTTANGSNAKQLNRSTSSQNARPNIFRFYVGRLHRAADFATLWSGIASILDNAISSGNQLISVSIPGSGHDASTHASHVPETLILLWNMLDYNERFRNFVLDDASRAPQLLCHLLYFTLLHKDSPPQQGLVRLCIFILQDISAERAFAINIGKSGSYPKGKLPAKYAPFGGYGSGADLLIQSVYHLLGSTKGVLVSLYPPLVISLTNTAAFWRTLSVTSASRLVQLLSSFSNPAFLLSDEGNPRLLYYMLEALSTVIQYQFASNPNLTYALCGRSRPIVQKLSNFSLRRGIAEIRRIRQSKAPIGARLAQTAAATGRHSSVASGPLSPASEIAGDVPGIPPPSPLPQDEEKRRIAEAEAEAGGAAEQTRAAGEDGPVATDEADAMAKAVDSVDLEDADPTAEDATTAEPSDRARGKMRQRSISAASIATPAAAARTEEDEWVDGLNEDELYEAASTIGRNGFVPSEAWVASWQRGLPLETLDTALSHLVPKVEQYSASVADKPNADERVLSFLREQSLSGILPQAPPIWTRPFQWNSQASIWLQSFLWGVIYVGSMLPFGIWAGTNARLFSLKVQESTRRRGSVDPTAALFNAGSMVTGAFGTALGGLGGIFGQSQPSTPATPRGPTPRSPQSVQQS